MKKTGMIMAILLLNCIFCTRMEDETDTKKPGYPARVDIIDGIKTVMNPDFPQDGRINYRIADAITLGGEEGLEEGILFFPYNIRVDSQDYIYVSDAEDMNIKIYDQSGNWIRNVGRRGQGPGEYTRISDFDVSQDGRIFISDIRQRRVSILRTDGTFVSSFLVKRSCDRLRVDETGSRIYFQQFISYRPKGTSGSKDQEIVIKRIDSRGKKPFEYGKFPAGKHVWRSKTEYGMIQVKGHVSQDAHTTVWIVGKGNRLYLGYSKEYLISVLDKKGKPIFRFGREFTPIKHPLYSPDLAHPEYYPAYYSRYFFFDDEENLWLKQYTEGDEMGHLYDVFSSDGIFIRQAVVPEKILRYQNGKAYTIVELESGIYAAKCYKLIEDKSLESKTCSGGKEVR
jgi:hypothetical protein